MSDLHHSNQYDPAGLQIKETCVTVGLVGTEFPGEASSVETLPAGVLLNALQKELRREFRQPGGKDREVVRHQQNADPDQDGA